MCDIERVQAVKLRGIMLTDKYSATHCWSAPHGNFAGIRFVVKSVNGPTDGQCQCVRHPNLAGWAA